MITDIETFFVKGCGRCPRFDTSHCSASLWSDGLVALRAICRDLGLTEALKWAHPCYMHADRNIAIIGAFRGDFRLSFFEAALLADPDGILERQGPNTQHPDMIRFTSAAQVTERTPQIRRYLEEAMRYADAGLRAPKTSRFPDMPEELIAALDADPAMAEAFAALTPGRQKGYILNLNGAKQSKTRVARIEKFRAKIIAGKGLTDR